MIRPVRGFICPWKTHINLYPFNNIKHLLLGVYRPNQVRMAIDLHYYTGKCTTLQVQRQTKHNFIQMIKGSPLWQSCQDPEFGNRCTTGSVKVTCARVPAVNGRKKRPSGKLLLGNVCTWKVLFQGQTKNTILGEGGHNIPWRRWGKKLDFPLLKSGESHKAVLGQSVSTHFVADCR